MKERYSIENATLKPTQALSLIDNWIAENIKYVTDHKPKALPNLNFINTLKELISKRIVQLC